MLKLADEDIESLGFEDAPHPIAICSRDDQRLIKCNAAFLKQFSLTLEQAIGANFSELDLWVDNERQGQWRILLQQQNIVEHFVAALKTGDGQVILMSLSAYRVDHDANLHSVHLFRDTDQDSAIHHRLQNNELRTQLALESGQVGIWEWNIQTHELKWDNTMLALYGIERHEFCGNYTAWCSRLHPDDREATETVLQKVLAGHAHFSQSFRIIWPNGSIHAIKGSALVIRNDNGTPLRMIGTNWNDNDYSNTRQQLQLLHRAIDSAPSAFFWINAEGIVIHANLAACDSLGYDLNELIGKPMWDFDPDFSPAIWWANWQALVKEKYRRYESRHQHRDGHRFLVSIVAHYLLIHESPHSFMFVENISEFKHNEKRLQRFEAIIQSSAEAIISTSLDGTIESWNPAAEQLFGYSSEEIIGRPIALLLPGDQSFQDYDIRDCIQQGAKLPRYETIRVHKDGSLIEVSVTLSPIRNAEGNVIAICKLLTDIRTRKKLEDAGLQAMLANQSKTHFISNMSHEIRSPLNSILGMSELLHNDTHLSDAQRLKVKVVSDASKHLLAVVNDILDISKIEAGKMQILEDHFDLHKIIVKLDSLIGAQIRAKGLHFVKQLNVVNTVLLGDAMRLTQILLNYLSNALKFTKQGEILLRIDTEREDESHCELRFSVEDSGIGITAEQMKRLFKPFEQANADTTQYYGGTGLGLSITRHLAQLMGGDVGVFAREGGGSVFWCSLRFTKQKNSSTIEDCTKHVPDPQTLLKRNHAGASVLVVDDDPFNCLLIEQQLHDIGFSLNFAKTGQQALEMAKSQSFAIILMDMQMPIMNGLDATQYIRQLPGYEATPIIALTANAFEEDRQTCLRAGMNDHLSKPIAKDILHQALLKWFQLST